MLFAATPPLGYQINPDTNLLQDKSILATSFFVSRKVAVLTFDDGPRNQEIDHKILETLDKHHTKSIWFVNCKNFDDINDPQEIVNRAMLVEIKKRGHLIGNHGFSHKNFVLLERSAPGEITPELKTCSDLIENVIGERPKYFRPPWGEFSELTKTTARLLGMQLVMWDANSNDVSFQRTPEKYLDYLKNSTGSYLIESQESGSIMLLHDFPHTASALDYILTRMENRGFEFVLPSTPASGTTR